MPEYRYIARELSGQQVTGVLTAGTEREAIHQLSAKNLFPLEVQPLESLEVQQRTKRRRVAGRLLAVFYMQLADLLRAGVPLLRSLDILERQIQHPALKMVVREVREDVADGTRLNEAMRRHPTVFSELAVSMVRAGEEGSFLEDALGRLAEFTEHQEELKGRILGAMLYPAFLIVVGTAVVIIMLVFFVPKFEPMFERLREVGQLPWATTALMALSHGLQHYGWIIGLLLVGGAAAAGHWIQSPQGRLLLDRWRLHMIGLGQISRSLSIARFCRVLGTLLKNGVPLLASLRIAKDATGNRVLSQAIAEAAEHISTGKTLARPLAESGQFPADVIEMISVGEEANNLEQVLINIADKMERQTNRQLDLAVKLLEPMMLVIMAGIILFIVVALMLPMLSSSQAV
ncbi:MAG: type IV pilus biogenesis protein PilC [Planctomycetaceae bacterium]|nr:MAG: type IV pilus biogenesis protein PilC [Planctomycetaceae bacterium]